MQHLTFIDRNGRHALPALSIFLSRFRNEFISHHVPQSVLTQLGWWQDTLSHPPLCRSLVSLPLCDLDLWVDASSSWGIGLYVGGEWAMWQLAPNWSSASQDIGWAEAVALELAVLWMAEASHHDTCMKVHCDNTSMPSGRVAHETHLEMTAFTAFQSLSQSQICLSVLSMLHPLITKWTPCHEGF